MLFRQDVLGPRGQPWYLSHIKLLTKLPEILATGNEDRCHNNDSIYKLARTNQDVVLTNSPLSSQPT